MEQKDAEYRFLNYNDISRDTAALLSQFALSGRDKCNSVTDLSRLDFSRTFVRKMCSFGGEDAELFPGCHSIRDALDDNALSGRDLSSWVREMKDYVETVADSPKDLTCDSSLQETLSLSVAFEKTLKYKSLSINDLEKSFHRLTSSYLKHLRCVRLMPGAALKPFQIDLTLLRLKISLLAQESDAWMKCLVALDTKLQVLFYWTSEVIEEAIQNNPKQFVEPLEKLNVIVLALTGSEVSFNDPKNLLSCEPFGKAAVLGNRVTPSLLDTLELLVELLMLDEYLEIKTLTKWSRQIEHSVMVFSSFLSFKLRPLQLKNILDWVSLPADMVEEIADRALNNLLPQKLVAEDVGCFEGLKDITLYDSAMKKALDYFRIVQYDSQPTQHLDSLLLAAGTAYESFREFPRGTEHNVAADQLLDLIRSISRNAELELLAADMESIEYRLILARVALCGHRPTCSSLSDLIRYDISDATCNLIRLLYCIAIEVESPSLPLSLELFNLAARIELEGNFEALGSDFGKNFNLETIREAKVLPTLIQQSKELDPNDIGESSTHKLISLICAYHKYLSKHIASTQFDPNALAPIEERISNCLLSYRSGEMDNAKITSMIRLSFLISQLNVLIARIYEPLYEASKDPTHRLRSSIKYLCINSSGFVRQAIGLTAGDLVLKRYDIVNQRLPRSRMDLTSPSSSFLNQFEKLSPVIGNFSYHFILNSSAHAQTLENSLINHLSSNLGPFGHSTFDSIIFSTSPVKLLMRLIKTVKKSLVTVENKDENKREFDRGLSQLKTLSRIAENLFLMEFPRRNQLSPEELSSLIDLVHAAMLYVENNKVYLLKRWDYSRDFCYNVQELYKMPGIEPAEDEKSKILSCLKRYRKTFNRVSMAITSAPIECSSFTCFSQCDANDTVSRLEKKANEIFNLTARWGQQCTNMSDVNPLSLSPNPFAALNKCMELLAKKELAEKELAKKELAEKGLTKRAIDWKIKRSVLQNVVSKNWEIRGFSDKSGYYSVLSMLPFLPTKGYDLLHLRSITFSKLTLMRVLAFTCPNEWSEQYRLCVLKAQAYSLLFLQRGAYTLDPEVEEESLSVRLSEITQESRQNPVMDQPGFILERDLEEPQQDPVPQQNPVRLVVFDEDLNDSSHEYLNFVSQKDQRRLEDTIRKAEKLLQDSEQDLKQYSKQATDSMDHNCKVAQG